VCFSRVKQSEPLYLTEQSILIRRFGGELPPGLFGIPQKVKQVNIISQVVANDPNHIGKSPPGLCYSLNHQHQELGDQAHPDLNFNGILEVAQEIL